MATVWAANWTICPCMEASTTWPSSPRSTTERHRGTGGGTTCLTSMSCCSPTCRVTSCVYTWMFPTVTRKPKKGRRPGILLTWSNSPRWTSCLKTTSSYLYSCVWFHQFLSCLSPQAPIQESLIDFSDSGMNRVAADIFLGDRSKGVKDRWHQLQQKPQTECVLCSLSSYNEIHGRLSTEKPNWAGPGHQYTQGTNTRNGLTCDTFK